MNRYRNTEEKNLIRMRQEALSRLEDTLTKQQIEDLQLVIKNTEEVTTWDYFGSDVGSICFSDAKRTLDNLANDLNFHEYDDETVEY